MQEQFVNIHNYLNSASTTPIMYQVTLTLASNSLYLLFTQPYDGLRNHDPSFNSK